jgi:excisionase family DNA binding protein
MVELLSPRELARAIGVSESSLKRWTDRGLLRSTRTAGGHRRIRVAEAIRFIRESGATVLRPELLGLPELGDGEEPGGPRGDRLAQVHALLLEGRARDVTRLLLALYIEGASVAWICDELLRRAMERLGELWTCDERGVFIEHRASDICLAALGRLRAILPAPDAGALRATGGAPSGDPYLLATFAAATVLAAIGADAVNLGPDTPMDALLKAARTQEAGMVWLSVSVAAEAPRLRSEVLQLAEVLRSEGRALIVGGRAAAALRLPESPGLAAGGSMEALATFAAAIAARGTRPAGIAR